MEPVFEYIGRTLFMTRGVSEDIFLFTLIRQMEKVVQGFDSLFEDSCSYYMLTIKQNPNKCLPWILNITSKSIGWN